MSGVVLVVMGFGAIDLVTKIKDGSNFNSGFSYALKAMYGKFLALLVWSF
jgi:hypothetical protein